MTTKIAAVLAAGLWLAACGGSGTPGAAKSEQGVRDAYAQFSSLVKAHKGKEACRRYLTAEAQTLANGLGGCAELMNEAGGDVDAQAPKSATVTGDKATYREPDGTVGHAVFDGDHWRFGLTD